jgi:hypothetical protein
MIPTPGLRTQAQRLLAASLLSLLGVATVEAQAPAFPVTGVVTDAAQVPAVGFRVVFRVVGTENVYLSPPTDEEGAYRIEVPAGTNLQPVAVVTPLGKRIALEGTSPQLAMPGLRVDLELAIRIAVVTEPRPFPGADRLFRSFVEDVVFVERQRGQARVSAADSDEATSYVSELLGAFNFTTQPWLEVGVRAGYAGTELDPAGTGASGPTDVDLWGKMLVYTSPRSGLRSAAGVVLTLPTGEPETGRAAGAAGVKLFGSLRHGVGRITLSASAGLRATDDSEVDGVDREGQVSGSLAAAAFVPFDRRLVGLAELGYESKRFEDGEDDASALVGVSWKVLREGILRLALGFGLSEGAPDTELTAGYAFEF